MYCRIEIVGSPGSDKETDNPLYPDERNFHKVERWTKDGSKVERMLYTGSNLGKAKDIFAEAVKASAAD